MRDLNPALPDSRAELSAIMLAMVLYPASKKIPPSGVCACTSNQFDLVSANEKGLFSLLSSLQVFFKKSIF